MKGLNNSWFYSSDNASACCTVHGRWNLENLQGSVLCRWTYPKVCSGHRVWYTLDSLIDETIQMPGNVTPSRAVLDFFSPVSIPPSLMSPWSNLLGNLTRERTLTGVRAFLVALPNSFAAWVAPWAAAVLPSILGWALVMSCCICCALPYV